MEASAIVTQQPTSSERPHRRWARQQIVASHNEWTCVRPMPSRCNWIKNTAYVVSFDNGKQILTSLRSTVSINALDSHDGRGAQTRTLKPNPVAPFFPDSSR